MPGGACSVVKQDRFGCHRRCSAAGGDIAADCSLLDPHPVKLIGATSDAITRIKSGVLATTRIKQECTTPPQMVQHILNGRRFSKRVGRRVIVSLFAPSLAGYKWIFVPVAKGSQERGPRILSQCIVKPACPKFT